MSATTGLPASIVIRDLLLTMWFNRGRILLIVAAAMAVAGVAAFQVRPKYEARSSLLVLLGSEYGFRPTAGQQYVSNFNVGTEELLRTEADIIDSSDLHRRVIEQIGVQALYPDLLKPPGLLAQYTKMSKAYLYGLLGRQEASSASGQSEAIKQADVIFESNFAYGVDRKSDIITLSFQHPNAALSAQVLSVLEAQYFELRAKLFADKQVSIVMREKAHAAAQMAAADTRLATFRRTHDISDFTERQKILMSEQGSLEDQIIRADSAIAGLQARLDDLAQQLRLASGQTAGHGTPNAAGPLQGMVETYRRRQAEAQTTYRGSPAYDTARTDALKAQEEVARMRSTQAFTLQQEVTKTQAELRGNEAARDAARPQLAKVNNEIDALNAQETELHELERTRGVLEDNYKSIAKTASDRELIETVDAAKQPSVRVVEAPSIPYLPQPVRKQILMAGLIVGVVLAIVVSLISSFFRGVYLRPEALEIDTGLVVLATVPDQKSLSAPVILVTPR